MKHQNNKPVQNPTAVSQKGRASKKSSFASAHLDGILVKGVPLEIINDLAIAASGDDLLFAELVQLSLAPPVSRAAKASWAMAKASLLSPSKIYPWQQTILDAISKAPTGGIKRELLKSLFSSTLHQEGSPQLFDLCLSLIDGREDRGVIHYAMDHLEMMVKFHPELKSEVAHAVQIFKSKASGNLPYKIRVFRP